MKRFLTRVSALAVAGAMCFTTACGSKPAENATATDTSGNAAQTVEKTEEGTDQQTAQATGSLSPSGTYKPSDIKAEDAPKYDPFGKYEPEVNVKLVHTANDAAFWFPEGDDINNNIYTRTWKETLGVNYSFMWTCPGSQAEEKINIMLTSGDLPDMFGVSRNQFAQLHKANLLEDLTSSIMEYGSQYTKKYLTGDYAYLMKAAERDDKVFGITNGFAYQDASDMIWIRADWLKNLNIPTPKTFTELEAVMEAFLNNDPDQNGQNDTYPIALMGASIASWQWGAPNAFFNMFDVYPNIWMKDSSGNLQEGLLGQEQRVKTKAAIEKLAEYYQKGYISKEFTSYDDARYQEELFSDKCGIVFGGIWEAYWPLVLHKDSNPNADWVPIAIPGVNGKPGKTSNSIAIVNNINVVKKGFSNPEALVKMCNLYHDLNNNPETMKFADFNNWPSDNNQIFLAYPLLIFNPSFNYEGYQAISKAFESGDESGLCEAYKLFYDQAKTYKDSGDASGWPPYRSYTKDGSIGVIDEYIKNKNMQFNEYTEENTTFMIENAPTYKKIYDEMILNVITGNEDIAKFDEFLAQYDSIYYNEASKEINQWFESKGKESIQDWFEK